jgi:tRNA (guanine-N7-)-methyltransferase
MSEDFKEKLWWIVEKIPFKSENLIVIKKDYKLNPEELFGERYKKYFLELGSGWGEVGVELAKQNPDTGFILMEKNRGRLLYTDKLINQFGLKNLKLACANFNWFLQELYTQNAFDEILLNFPDPWPKKKHRINRTINADFIHTLKYLLKSKGRFRFATDHGGYGRKAISILRKTPILKKEIEYSFLRENFPISVFEKEKREEKKTIYYLERFNEEN